MSLKSRTIRRFFEGKPSLIIVNGRLNYKEMIRQRYSLDDLLLALRQKQIRDLSEVEYAFLETNGKLSIFKYKMFHLSSNYPMPLIVDGEINDVTLNKIHKSEEWLKKTLSDSHLELKTIFYAFYKNHKIYFIKKGR